MKAVQVLINSYLPEDLRDYTRTYDAGSINRLMYEVAQKYPDRFAEIEKKIADTGRNASYLMGSSITLDDLESQVDRKAFFKELDAALNSIPKGKDHQQQWREVSQKFNTKLERMSSQRALANRNNIAMSVMSGARGKGAQLKAMIETPWTFSDYKDEPIDIISRESFADGIRPYIFAASTNGSRAAVVSAKVSTAKGGDLAKQFAQSAADMIVRKDDCGTSNGISLDIDDDSLYGRALAKDTGKYKAGEFVTREMLHDLRKSGQTNVVVRSALTCSVTNGLCAHCVGKFYKGGKLPKIGDDIGAVAATVTGEPVTQMALSAKHTAGMTKDKKTYSGLPIIQQFTQSPGKFKDRGAVSEVDGRVDRIEDADQGGKYIFVAGKAHYVPAGHEPEVKVGQMVEAGDQLAEGLVDAEDIVRLKGLGEGRLYYARRLGQILADSGAKTDPRNLEVLSRSVLRHVRVTGNDPVGRYEPDDLIDYNALQGTYRMPEGTSLQDAGKAVGKYLQQPVMHYTIGTRITPSVVKKLGDAGYKDVYASDSKPAFKPEMVRLRAASHSNEDWLASLGTSYLTRQLQEASARGDDTNIEQNSDYRPRLMAGAGFADNVGTTGMF